MDAARLRAAFAAFLIALVASLVAASPALDPLRGLSIDVLTALRWRIFGNAHPPESSAAVVVALDEETFRTPPFDSTPSVTWTREIGQVLTAIIDGGAKVVAFDIIFPTSIEQSAVPFGDGTLGGQVRGFDRDYLRALALGARAGKVVLGQVQHQDRPLLPSPGQRAAVGFGRNIRALNVHSDPDDVIRRVPLSFETDGENVPSMAAELAARGSEPKSGAAVAPPPRQGSDMLTLNFEGGANDIPTYSLADLYACVAKGDGDFFRRHFGGKVVLLGTVLDVEDRKITSKRFATAPEGARAQRCALPMPVASQKFARDSIAGVYVHATAVNNLLRNDGLTEFGRIGAAVSSFVFAALAAAAALAFGPVSAAFATIGLAIAWIAAATVALRHALALPLVEPLVVGFAALGATIGYRFVIADHGKRLLRQSFALYLAPALIEKMLSSNKPPVLGGEMRNVTVYFSDIADFSSIAEKIPPAELVAAMNDYLSAMTDVGAGRFRRQVYRRRHRGGVRGAARRSGSRRQRRARGAAMRRAATHARSRERRVRPHGAPAHRAQLRRSADRQYRLAAALQLHRDGRHGEPRVAARGHEQVLRHDGHRLGGNGGADRPGVRLARARRDPRQGPNPAGADFRAARRGGRGRARPDVPRAGLWGRPDPVSCARFRRGGRAIRPGGRR